MASRVLVHSAEFLFGLVMDSQRSGIVRMGQQTVLFHDRWDGVVYQYAGQKGTSWLYGEWMGERIACVLVVLWCASAAARFRARAMSA